MARDDEILERLDQHMARSNEHMARGNELMAEVRKEHQLNRAAYERGTRLILEIVGRQEQAFRANTEAFRANAAALGRMSDAISELREEIRLIRLRLEGNGGPLTA